MIERDEAATTALTNRPGTVERAFQLAELGECSSLFEIERQLRKEGFDSVFVHLNGTLIRAQLRRAVEKAARQRARRLQPS